MVIVDAVVLSIGTELITGQCVDTNAAWLSAELTQLGMRVVQHVTVADDVDSIAEAIRRSLPGTDLVVATGGLGPTPDDLTREGLAGAIAEPLEESPEALEMVRGFFLRVKRKMPEANLRQALLPHGCTAVVNKRGTAPGIAYSHGVAVAFFLPGVPVEMRAMFRSTVEPLVRERVGPFGFARRSLHSIGISEARVGELLAKLMDGQRNPLLGITASRGIITVRVAARARSTAEAVKLADDDTDEIRRLLGHHVFGEADDSLESVVGDLLTRQGKTVSIAESCTGGLLAKRITDIGGSSRYFIQSVVTYSDEAKIRLLGVPEELIVREGAVSEAVVRAMASGCKTASGADFALAITGIAGPTGGESGEKPVGLVYVGLAQADGVEVKRLLLGEYLSRSEIRDRACGAALDLLRLSLLS